MELPAALKVEIETKCSAYKQASLISAAQAISERYRKESGRGKRLLTRDIEAMSYAVVRMPATYGAVSSALEYTFACFDEHVDSVLDVGAGTGAASWAVNELIDNPVTFTCLEREPAMIALGSSLMAADAQLRGAKWIRHDLATTTVTQHADIVIASYALNELDEKKRSEVLQNLWKCANKLLVIVEPGTPVGFAQLRQARNVLLGLDGHVIAPCAHGKECQLAEDDWCHFTCRVSRSRLHKLMKGGDAPYEDEKYAFLAMAKVPGRPVPSRILRHPLKEAGRITLKLCCEDGISEKAITKKHGDLFKKARKANSGDSFPKC